MGDRRPSLSIRDGEKCLLVTCFAGCDRQAILEEIRARGLLGSPASPERPFVRSDPPSPPQEPEPDPEAVAVWRAAEPIAGTLGEVYLREHRHIECDLPPTLRFLPEARHPRTGGLYPAVLAAVQRPDRTMVALQATFLDAGSGAKAALSPPRLTIGKLGTGGVRLAAAEAVLGIAEGVETALSAMELSGVPCWASLSGHRLGKITLPDIVREVHLFADSDAAGQLAAEPAATRYAAGGRRVVLRWPPEGEDWNDLLKSRAGEVAA